MSYTPLERTVAEVRAACDTMVEAERMKDVDGATELIWEDAVWMGPNMEPILGWDNIKALFAEFFDAMPFTDMTADIRGIRPSESGDMATAWGTFALIFDTPDGQTQESMNFLMSWEKRDGTWKAATNMFCSNMPLPEDG